MASGDFTPLRPKQKKYLEGRSQGMTKEQAKRFAQYADSTSTASIENSSVKAAFARIVRRAIPAHKLAQRIAEGLDATKVLVIEKCIEETPDYRERREYAKLAAEWAGYVEPEKGATETNVGVGFTLINNITAPKKSDGDEQR